MSNQLCCAGQIKIAGMFVGVWREKFVLGADYSVFVAC